MLFDFSVLLLVTLFSFAQKFELNDTFRKCFSEEIKIERSFRLTNFLSTFFRQPKGIDCWRQTLLYHIVD